AGDAGPVTLNASDGTAVAAYAARAEQPGGAGIVILPDVRGLHPFFEELALRFAEARVQAVAIDYFSRTAGTGRRPDGFEYEPHVMQLRAEAIQADIAAAVAYLGSPAGGSAERVYTVGFCIGGRISFVQAATQDGLAGVIGFYGWPIGEHRSGLPSPAALADRMTVPVLALWGGADRGIGPEVVAEFEAALQAAGVPHQSITYPDAPHSFFDRKATEFANASEDAWRQMLDFVGTHR
ncbi:MAG TPA: dienelactone hydrolase family protein, partial [Candidatus Limnocylindria bacterium]|nr:dienelactone hydrolase family protein [Candidatus Limnocylindria bacterium]